MINTGEPWQRSLEIGTESDCESPQISGLGTGPQQGENMGFLEGSKIINIMF